jgi:hypothetical protein
LKSSLIVDLDRIINETLEMMQIFKLHTTKKLETIAIFDQVDSTVLKTKLGMKLQHNKLFTTTSFAGS